jgi:hypothetical protein
MPWLYDHTNPATRRRTRVTVDAETSLPLIVSSQDTGPILDSAKALASQFDPVKPRTGSDEWTHVARIPLVIWNRLNRLGITRDEKALNAWLQLPEAANLRTDDRRVL